MTRYYLLISIVGASLACIADLSLLYVPYGTYEQWDYAFFKDINQARLYLGHFLGIFFIPLELLGFIAVRKALVPAPNWYINFITALTIYMTVLGVAYHAMLGSMASFGHLAAQQQLVANVTASHQQILVHYFEPLGNLLLGLFIVMSLSLARAVWVYPTQYPRYAAWCNPLSVYLIVVGLYCLHKPIGSAFMVAGFNLSVLTWLIITQLAILKNK